MNISLVAVGKMKSRHLLQLIEEYKIRIHGHLDIKEVILKEKENLTEEAFLSVVPEKSVLIALDEHGISLSSLELSQHVESWKNQGSSHLSFVIGGDQGLPHTLLKKADLVLSFGRATWPHMLVRLLLVEQIYRVQQILSGHPYHRA